MRKKKKNIVTIFVLIILAGILFIMNFLSGNPISKMNAQKQYLQYFENTYNEKFTVYDSEYNLKIPGYVFKIGPQNNETIRFNTALYGMGISDEYGGIIASSKLAEELSLILIPKFEYLNFEITVKEDPLIGYGEETPDYFETDPVARIQKNHYIVTITWKDSETNKPKISGIFSGMVEVIENQLPYTTPNLTVNIYVKSDENVDKTIFSDSKFLFSTIE